MDQQLLLLINREWTSPALDWLMAVMSSWPLWWPLLFLGGASVAIWGGFRGRVFLAVAGLAVGINDGIFTNSLKPIVNRPRPHEVVAGVRTLDLERVTPRVLAVFRPLRVKVSSVRIEPRRGNSFPSGHASNNFAFAAVCAVFYRRWGWMAFFPAALVAYSRIYVGSHWPLDVAFSVLLGTGIGLLTAVVAEWGWRRFGPRYAPDLALSYPTLWKV